MSSVLAGGKKKKAQGERTANLQNDFFSCLLLETREWNPAPLFPFLQDNFLGLISRVPWWVDQLPAHSSPSSPPVALLPPSPFPGKSEINEGHKHMGLQLPPGPA